MPDCPRCHQPVDTQAIACPHCRTPLKAHGHPGIPLYRATGNEYLCQTCTYEEDDTCTFPQRPYAKECTLYHNRLDPVQPLKGYSMSRSGAIRAWFRQNAALLVLIGLLVVSVLLVLSGR